jgi:hypothetical protein
MGALNKRFPLRLVSLLGRGTSGPDIGAKFQHRPEAQHKRSDKAIGWALHSWILQSLGIALRKARISAPISATWVSRAKCPVS